MASKLSWPKALKRWRTAIFCGVVALLTAIALLPHFASFKFFYAVEQSALSLRLLLRGVESPSEDAANVVIVAIDDRSLYPEISEADLAQNPQLALLQSWPWNRAIYAYLAERLYAAGASVVAFDFVFPTPNDGDLDFYEMIEANLGSVVLGYDYVFSENELGETLVKERLPYDDLLPLEEVDLLGFVNIERNDDGVLRQAKLSTNIYAENQRFIDDSLKFKRIEMLGQRSPKYLSLGAQAAVLKDPTVAARIPELFDWPLINYGGLSYFRTISAIDLILDDRYAAQKGAFKDAVVFVGPYSDRFKDVVPTPLGDMFGVETHAHVARSLLNNSFYFPLPVGWVRIVLLGLALTMLIGNLRMNSALKKGGWSIALLLGYLVMSQFLFVSARLVLPVVAPIFVLGVGGAVLLLFDFAISQYERVRLKGYLSRYVSPEVANLLTEDSSHLETLLQGANRPIAVMFSDIRGFTTLSEQYSPQALVEHLNEYFERMVDCIHRYNGSLNKYIGDAILAFWGGIYTAGAQQDCLACLKTALEMQRQMDNLNVAWSQQAGRMPLQIGIGISFGEGFVGNLGHSQRMEFAVMGDVVNLGSRLEGATKQYGCGILVSESVYLHCRDAFHFQEMDIIQVKGKTQGVRVYAPLNAASEAAPSWLGDWQGALQCYRDREFVTARARFEALAAAHQSQVTVARLYAQRCIELEQSPPPADWDFVYIMQTK